MIKIKDIPISSRPREKAYLKGIKSLSDAELLAIIIGNGTKSKSALDIAYDLLCRFGSIEGLSSLNINELMEIEGIKKVKAIKLISSFELIRRFENETMNKRIKINTIEKVMRLLIPKCIGEKQEKLFLVLLNENYGFLRIVQLYVGTKTEISFRPREILQEIVKSDASKVYIAHNHPTDNINPSMADVESTRMLSLYLESFSVEVLDSLIVGKTKTYSIMTDRHINNMSIIQEKRIKDEN